MSENIRLLSEISRCEIINVSDGEKYNAIINNDIIIDENGYLKFLIVNLGAGKISFFNKNDFLEIPWDTVKKIGAKTILIDADEDVITRSKL
ncbi:YlmC/YmxH family sporulation protein [Inconstantimicrobium mannanitabidum]|uniref:Photosystem reaction center subunit H n=1 Tax=Inconstantimicrobium mannanitabidum TaxID=1604901 RepID=A0ACB5RAW1_9CLOT|nr:YlmC/YmxH family sporulation protein [Clostridium sp. TW13]GKX66318.1 photosystem reaction center subunit H [Clostridium sp. TW13]